MHIFVCMTFINTTLFPIIIFWRRSFLPASFTTTTSWLTRSCLKYFRQKRHFYKTFQAEVYLIVMRWKYNNTFLHFSIPWTDWSLNIIYWNWKLHLKCEKAKHRNTRFFSQRHYYFDTLTLSFFSKLEKKHL